MTNAETTNSHGADRAFAAAAKGTAADPTEVSMNSRFLTNSGLSLIGAFTVVASIVWAPPTFMWLMFAAGVLAVALAAAAAIRGRGRGQRTLDGVIGILGAWTIVASLVFTAGVVTWLGFASGAAFVGLAFAGLALHEVHTERVVHAFELRTPAEEPSYAPARG